MSYRDKGNRTVYIFSDHCILRKGQKKSMTTKISVGKIELKVRCKLPLTLSTSMATRMADIVLATVEYIPR